MGRPKDLKQQAERAVQSPTGRSGQRGTTPARRLLRPTSSTGALASDSSHLRTASPIGRPGPSTTSDSDPASPTGVRRNPAHRSSLTGATRANWAHLTGDAHSERTRGRTEKASQGAQVKPRYQGPYPVRLQEQYSATVLTQIVL